MLCAFGIRLDHVAIHQQSAFPNASRSTTARMRPTLNLLGPADSFISSRRCRSGVEPGSRQYSALSHPFPLPCASERPP